ncbi:phage portal protein [Paludibacterium sp. dN 18-1]|uniref:Phage portal protein n=1 Tax=Paludibacterium denitrificans TaxID=2675226 RepID=A0A844GBE4_9NEIS|nr:phage portal protein [Paludibacterium denitrificans]
MIGDKILEPLSREKVKQTREQWQEQYAGFRNAGGIAVLQDGLKFSPLAMTNSDAQLIEARKLSSLEITQIFKVPPHKVGLLDRATNNNIEQQAIEFVVYCLMPWIRRREQAMARDLLLPKDRRDYYIEYNVSGLLRGDQGEPVRSLCHGPPVGMVVRQ